MCIESGSKSPEMSLQYCRIQQSTLNHLKPADSIIVWAGIYISTGKPPVASLFILLRVVSPNHTPKELKAVAWLVARSVRTLNLSISWGKL